MTTQTRTGRYQKRELLASAACYGFALSEDQFDCWVAKGLLGEADERVWPGRGSIAWWSQEQLELFLNMLALRQSSPTNIPLGQLCHVPVWRWLYWGELGGVTLKQVQRAIATWIDFQQRMPEDQVRKDITQTMRRYRGPQAVDNRALIEELTATLTFRKAPDKEVLRALLEPVVNAYPRKVAKGPVRTSMDLAECWSLIHALCFPVVQEKDLLFSFPDAFWEWARCFILIGYGLFSHERPHLANDPVLGSLFLRQTVQSLCPQACHTLLTWLGLATQQELAPWHVDPLRFLDPQAWQDGDVVSIIKTQVLTSSLVLPGGKPISYLRNEITLSYRKKQTPFIIDLPFL